MISVHILNDFCSRFQSHRWVAASRGGVKQATHRTESSPHEDLRGESAERDRHVVVVAPLGLEVPVVVEVGVVVGGEFGDDVAQYDFTSIGSLSPG